uniref:TubC_N domain-containing protein n=1 Tax=Strongyloides papillosus TaxID=174720 RepID=A0A0N5C1S6_STREA
MNTTNSNPLPTAPNAQETPRFSRIANFDAIFTIRSKQWKDEQKLLSVGRISTKEEKERLIKAQMDELTELMALCEIPERRSAILPVIWDTRKANSLQNELSKTILCNAPRRRYSENQYKYQDKFILHVR